MHKKKKGFTVMELLIVMSLMATILGIVWGIFDFSNKTISSVTIKSDLQSEGQSVQEKISNIMMQATEIESIDGDASSGELNSIKIMSYASDLTEEEFTIEKRDLGVTYKDGGKKYELLINNKAISSNIKDIKISNEDIIGYDENGLKGVNSIEFNIILEKEDGYNKDIEYPISVKCQLRNAGKN